MLSRYCFIPVILPTLRRPVPSGPGSHPLHEPAQRGSTRLAGNPECPGGAGARARPVRDQDFDFWYGLDLRSLHRLPGQGPPTGSDARYATPPGHPWGRRPIVSEPLAITGIDEEI